ETLHHVREHGGDDRLMLGRLFGQEKNLTTAAIARMNLFLHGAEDFQIVRGDTLRSPAFFSGDQLATFDCVIANPPFSLSSWGEEEWASDPWGRNLAGTPPKSYGDWAWVQHMIASIAPKSLGASPLWQTEASSQRRTSPLSLPTALTTCWRRAFTGTRQSPRS